MTLGLLRTSSSPRISRPSNRPRVSPGASLAALLVAGACAVGCGGAPPPAAPVASGKPAPAAKAPPPPDVSAVPEPDGLLALGRVAKPDGVVRTVGGWTNLPLPGANDLLRSITDDTVGDAVDLTQPVDGVVALGGSHRDPKPLMALSVAVRSFEDARVKLSAAHPTTPGPNGSLFVTGIGKSSAPPDRAPKREEDADDDQDDEGVCLLAHAAQGARLVCGDTKESVDVLAPYLARTMPRRSWPSDVHVEVRLAPLREPLGQVRATLPILARSVLGSQSPALRELVDASVNEVVDIVGDTSLLSFDANVKDAGVDATTRIDYSGKKSLLARLAMAHPEPAQAPPPALFHLPADADTAMFGRAVDPKLLDHPRELLANVLLETAEGANMPEAERKSVRDLVAERILPLFAGEIVYGKGVDMAALEHAMAERRAVKTGGTPADVAAADAAETELATQLLGWHLVRVSQPVTEVGPMLKDWAQLWKRPAFVKWAKARVSSKKMAQVRTAALPQGVTLPKGAVHLEIVVPRSDLEIPPPPPPAPRAGAKTTKPGKPAKPKTVARKPIILHVLAVPDQGATWLAFGLDAKLAARKAAAALSTAPDADTLGTTPAAASLRGVKANAAWMLSLRGLLVYTAIDGGRFPFGSFSSLPSHGATPIVATFASKGPSQGASVGSAVSTFALPRAAIEDLVRLAMSMH